MRWWRDDQLEQHVRALDPLLVPGQPPRQPQALPQLTGRRVASRGPGFAILDVRSRTRAAGQRALVIPSMREMCEWPLRLRLFGSHPLDGPIHRGSPDAEQFGELSLM
jgi:hypothetical protein